ncbi:MAG: HD-GYP domain-containing protein [Pseudobdellovibrionaceae bacterium]
MEYVPIRVSTLRGDQKIDFDAFIKINEKYILYLRKGDSFEGERLKRLKSKKLKKMFILPDAENNYRDYLHKNIEMAYDKGSGKELTNRAEVIQGNQQSNAEAVMENPENEIIYNETKDAVGKFVDFLNQEDPDSFSTIMSIENADQSIAHHGVTVSTLAIALAKRLNLTDPRQMQLLSLGALLHDFEHFHSGLSISRPLSDLSEDEMRVYKTHPRAGAQKVQDKKHFDQTVINIISQHEEYVDGKGFPNGLPEAKMDPLAVIVASCNALDRLITFEGVPKKEAVRRLMITGVGKYPLNHIQLLGDIMNTLQLG